MGEAGQALVSAGRAAFVQGVGDAILIGCVVLAVAAVVVFFASGPRARATVVVDEGLVVA